MTAETRKTLADIKPGDILEFVTPDCLGRVIQFYVRGRSQHVGLVAKRIGYLRKFGNTQKTSHPGDNRLVVWESTMSLPMPCLFAGKRVKGVGVRLLDKRIEYTLKQRGRVWVHPLVVPLTDEESRELAWACYRTRGTPYDWWGAFQARTLGGRWLTRTIVPSVEDAGKLFCCEADAFWLRAVGRFERDNAGAFNPKTFLKAQHEDEMHGLPFEVTLAMLK